MTTHHSFGYSLAHDGEKVPDMDRAERKRRYGGRLEGDAARGWLDDLPTRVWRMRLCNLWVNVAQAAASKVAGRKP